MVSDGNKTLTIEELLDYGKRAQVSQYAALLAKLQLKEPLTSAEWATMNRLEKELRGQLPASGDPSRAAVPNLLRAVDYLQGQGYQVKKSTVYAHAKACLIKRNPQGGYDLPELDRYASANLKRIAGADGAVNPEQAELDRLQRDKLEAATAIAQEQARHWQNKNLDLEKKIDSIVGTELAKREQFFRTYLMNWFTGEAPALIEAMGGDHQYVPDFLIAVRKALDLALGHLTKFRGMEIYCTPEGEIVEADR